MARLGVLLLIGLMLAAAVGMPADKGPEVFEGDMVLSGKQNQLIKEAIKTGKSISSIESEKFAATTAVFPKWTNGIVPYVLSSSLSSRAISAIRQGFAEWQKLTCIRFKRRTSEPNYLEFFRGSGCWGHVGMGRGKSQISVGNGCEYRHVMTHEIGHALGFFHEQSRTDRDDYVKIEWGNIQSGLRSAFEKYGKDKLNSLGQPYDYGSIMHYPWNAFSTNGRNTLVPKRKVYQQPYRVLSQIDAIQAKLMYNCGGVKPKPVTKVPKPPEPTTSNPWTVEPVTKCKEVVVEETVVVTGGSCAGDQRRSCGYWARRGECSRNPSYMRKYCCRSCGVQTSCRDKDGRCRGWAARGECNRNPRYMWVNCAKSCNRCRRKTKIVRKKVRKCTVVPVTVMPPIPTTELQSPPIPTDKPNTGMPPIPTDKPDTGMPPIPTDKPDTGIPPIPTDKPDTGVPPIPTDKPDTGVPPVPTDKPDTGVPPVPTDKPETGTPPIVTGKPTTVPPVTTPPLPALCKVAKKSGMEDGSLKDENLSASSSYSNALSASAGRLGRTTAWCSAVSNDKQYLAIDIGKLTIVKEVITQGLDVPLAHFVKKFYISYSEDNKLWNNVVGASFWAIKEFAGNTDGRSQVSNSIDPPIVARYIRIHPVEWKTHICLRAELNVC